jgi:hypothetical protein
MERVVTALQAEIKFNHVPYFRRFLMFVSRKRFRFFMVGLIYGTFVTWSNVVIFGSAKLERSFKQFKQGQILKYSPWCMGPATAIETMWEPTSLSRQSTEQLGELFVRLDRELKEGVSRQLIEKVLVLEPTMEQGITLKQFIQLVEQQLNASKIDELSFVRELVESI